MDKNFKLAMLERIWQGFGPSRFSTFMLKHISQWKDIQLINLLDVLDEFKYTGQTYTFFPFFYIYLRVNVYEIYKKQAIEKEWDVEKVQIQIKSFERHILLDDHKEDRLKAIEQSEKDVQNILQEVMQRLIDEGAPRVRNTH